MLNIVNFEIYKFLKIILMEKKSQKKLLYSLIGLLLLIIIGYFLYSKKINYTNEVVKQVSTKTEQSTESIDSNFLKAVIEDTSKNDKTSATQTDSSLQIEEDRSAGFSIQTFPPNAKRINIALIGTDGRIGHPGGHADANHIISILPDYGKIEIISIPRDTYVDCGYDDSTGLNKLTVYYLGAGRQAYLKKIAEIASLNSIPYYVEFGFSQALGILRWLGFNSSETLQLLRSRKSFAIGDYQRVYNQAQFIRQNLISHFDLFNGPLKSVIIHGLLSLVNTNLTYDQLSSFLDELDKKNFKSSTDNVVIKVRPSLKVNFKVLDFSDPKSVEMLRNKLNLDQIAKQDTSAFQPKDFQLYLTNKLNKLLDEASLDTAKSPAKVISKLSNYYDQKIWLQISDDELSLKYSKRFAELLINAYSKKNNIQKARAIKNAYIAEEEFFFAKHKK